MGKLNLTRFCSRHLANESDPSDRASFGFFFNIIGRVMSHGPFSLNSRTLHESYAVQVVLCRGSIGLCMRKNKGLMLSLSNHSWRATRLPAEKASFNSFPSKAAIERQSKFENL